VHAPRQNIVVLAGWFGFGAGAARSGLQIKAQCMWSGMKIGSGLRPVSLPTPAPLLSH
jgi:hypothetical protein